MIKSKTDFSAIFKAVAEKNQMAIEDVTAAGIFHLDSQIVKKSPVDTGRFRGNWFSKVGQPSKFYMNTDRQPVINTKNIRLAIKNGSKYYFVNNLPYARVIEYGLYPSPVKRGTRNRITGVYEIRSTGGFSKQAPSGVLRTSILNWRTNTLKELKRLK